MASSIYRNYSVPDLSFAARAVSMSHRRSSSAIAIVVVAIFCLIPGMSLGSETVQEAVNTISTPEGQFVAALIGAGIMGGATGVTLVILVKRGILSVGQSVEAGSSRSQHRPGGEAWRTEAPERIEECPAAMLLENKLATDIRRALERIGRMESKVGISAAGEELARGLLSEVREIREAQTSELNDLLNEIREARRERQKA